MLGLMLLTSKGAAGVALIVGIDRFMSEARALTNLIGNGVATVVVGKWCKQLDETKMQKTLDGETDAEAEDPEAVMVAEEDRVAGAGTSLR